VCANQWHHGRGAVAAPYFSLLDSLLLVGKFPVKKHRQEGNFHAQNLENLAGLSRAKLCLSVF